jgi:CRP-like cAMP-binding protein
MIPLGKLNNEQMDLLLQKSELLPLYKGQTLLRAGDIEPVHYYLIYGAIKLVSYDGDVSIIQAGDAASFSPIANSFPRTSTVIADIDATVLKVNIEQLENLLCWGQVARCLLSEIAYDDNYADDYVWIKKLVESKLFFKIASINIIKILNKFKEQTVKAGELVINQGDEGTSCYLIKSGEAHVFIDGCAKDPIAFLEPGSVFGEDALVTDSPRNASVIMLTDGILMRLEKLDFYQLLAKPAVSIVTPAKVYEFFQAGAKLLDVRTQQEFDINPCPHAMNMPLHLIYLKSILLNKDTLYITCSTTEERAKAAAYFLNEQGFKAFALQTGINALNVEKLKV